MSKQVSTPEIISPNISLRGIPALAMIVFQFALSSQFDFHVSS
jgi:hypothetical protein